MPPAEVKLRGVGVDPSFAELSPFVREDGRWGYASGRAVMREELPPH